MPKGAVIPADRNYFRPVGARAAVDAGAHVLIRLRWSHSSLNDEQGRDFHALAYAKSLKVGQVGEWPVRLLVAGRKPIRGHVVATNLPAPLAGKC